MCCVLCVLTVLLYVLCVLCVGVCRCVYCRSYVHVCASVCVVVRVFVNIGGIYQQRSVATYGIKGYTMSVS